ncbi:MAG: Gfo/Idh/MocA family oxidoreductase [Rhodoferax sp.]|nr:Gfo/Idh/MocA family oxidoreductase [Rhodoferax sp.]
MTHSSPSTSVPPTRIAIAGFGAWGQMHAKAIDAIDGAEVVAVLARSDAARTAARDLVPQAVVVDDLDALLALEGVDVVNVTVPNHLHAATAVRALDAGRHVFLEKPMGLDLAECDAVADAAQRNARQVAVNYELRVSRQWGLVREQIAQGVLGAVRYQHLTLFRKPFRTGAGGWRYDPARVGSWVLEELVHFIDLVLWYAEADGMPCRVSAFGGDPNQPLADFQTVVLQWPGGATAVLSQCLGGFEHHTVLEVAGSQGALRTWWSGAMDRTTTPSFDMKLRHGDADAVSLEIPLSGEVFELEEHLRQAYAGFAQGRSVMSPQQARPSIVVALAVDRALREGRAIELA